MIIYLKSICFYLFIIKYSNLYLQLFNVKMSVNNVFISYDATLFHAKGGFNCQTTENKELIFK